MMSHVTLDQEVNLPIVPTSQCVFRVQTPGRCAPKHLWVCCCHYEFRPQDWPRANPFPPLKKNMQSVLILGPQHDCTA